MIDAPPRPMGAPPGPVATDLVEVFVKAFTANQMLSFSYTDREARRTKRCVEPHGLLVAWPKWYVIAWDQRPDASRLFRADRIAKPKMTEEHFVPRPHDVVMKPRPNAVPARSVPPE